VPHLPEQRQPGSVMNLAQFALEIGPQVSVQNLRTRSGKTVQVATSATAGSDDEIWLKLLARLHGHERHTSADWRALIDKLRDMPAHPSDPRYKG